MKKILLTSFALLSLGSSNVFAIAGGPFDNGDPGGLLLERGGFYSASFVFNNGNGYGHFTPDALLSGDLPGAQQAGTATSQIGSFGRTTLYTDNTFDAFTRNANRSVFYYKGVTYAGGCFGYVDLEHRSVTGGANATSSETATQQTLSQSTGAFSINAGQTASNTQNVVVNNAGFVLNVGYEGTITRTSPTLRFRGKGELAVLGAGGQSSINSLAFDGYSGLINAIVNSVSNSDNPNFAAAQAAITNALQDLSTNYAQAAGPDQFFNEADVTTVRVYGSRRFF